MRLTEDEHDILESVERGDWRRMTGLAEEKGRFEVAARATLRKDKRVNIRMSEGKWRGVSINYAPPQFPLRSARCQNRGKKPRKY